MDNPNRSLHQNPRKRKFGHNLTNLPQTNHFELEKSSFFQPFIIPTDTNLLQDPLQIYLQQIEDYTVTQSFLRGIHGSYMEWQEQVTPKMRSILVGWIIFIHHNFNLKEETLHFGVMLLDQYCSIKNVEKHRYQLLGITCLFMAAKYHELVVPKLKNYSKVCDGIFHSSQILQMESQVLQTLEFQLSNRIMNYEILQSRMNRMLETVEYGMRQTVKKISQYILTLTLIEYEFCLLNGNYVTAVVMYIGAKMREVKEINSKLIINSFNLSPSMFKEYFHRVVRLYNSRYEERFEPINKKYNIVIRN